VPRERLRWTVDQNFLVGKFVLLLKEDPLISFGVQDGLEDQGAVVHAAQTCAQALGFLEQHAVSFGVLDHLVGDEDCTRVAAECRRKRIPFVLATGAVNVKELGAAALLAKPYQIDDLFRVIASLGR
jgi:DNA-binding response OmpR family regulator